MTENPLEDFLDEINAQVVYREDIRLMLEWLGAILDGEGQPAITLSVAQPGETLEYMYIGADKLQVLYNLDILKDAIREEDE